MELTSKLSGKKAKKRTAQVSWDSFIARYAQEVPAQTDPNAVQMGQSIYDGTGTEYVIIEDDPTTTNKTIMPTEQSGQPVPEGVKTIEDVELAAEYGVQEPQTMAAKIAPEFTRN